jgi:hypothetical protein
MKNFELLHFTVAKKMGVNCSTLSSHFFCHLLESGLARINWFRAVYQFRVEQLICCQKCWANDCRAIAFRAVHPHSYYSVNILILKGTFCNKPLHKENICYMNYMKYFHSLNLIIIFLQINQTLMKPNCLPDI